MSAVNPRNANLPRGSSTAKTSETRSKKDKGTSAGPSTPKRPQPVLRYLTTPSLKYNSSGDTTDRSRQEQMDEEYGISVPDQLVALKGLLEQFHDNDAVSQTNVWPRSFTDVLATRGNLSCTSRVDVTRGPHRGLQYW